MGTLFIVLPMVWLGDMAGMMSQGVGQIRQSTGMFGQMVMQRVMLKGK
ncbi:hypothetical protein [Xenorhabdus bovienii]|nr:hypothetical protein [Xenorhabdus bovienii]